MTKRNKLGTELINNEAKLEIRYQTTQNQGRISGLAHYKMYTIRCPHCKQRVFDANYADIEIKCPRCNKVFEVKLEIKAG